MAAQRLFGYAADEVIGKPNTILIPPDRFDAAPQDRSHRRLRQTRVACPLLLQRQRQAGDADWRRRRGHLPIDYVYWSPDLAQLVSTPARKGRSGSPKARASLPLRTWQAAAGGSCRRRTQAREIAATSPKRQQRRRKRLGRLLQQSQGTSWTSFRISLLHLHPGPLFAKIGIQIRQPKVYNHIVLARSHTLGAPR